MVYTLSLCLCLCLSLSLCYVIKGLSQGHIKGYISQEPQNRVVSQLHKQIFAYK